MVRNVEAELGQGAGLRIGAPCDVARIPEERSTPVAAEEIDPEALIETATSTHSVHPPSPISEVSPQTQESSSPSDTVQHPVSPLGGAIPTPDPEGAQTYREIIDSVRLARRELQAALLALRNDQVHLDAFFNSGHIDGLSATIDRPISFYDSITATDRQPATHPSLESLKRKIDLLQITIWILKSDFNSSSQL